MTFPQRETASARHHATSFVLVAAVVVVLVSSALLGYGAQGRPAATRPVSSVVVPTATEPLRILLLGDSLAWEARGPFTASVTAHARAVVQTDAFGGSALCDWLALLPGELTRFKPQVVVVEFSGNALTPCTDDPVTRRPLTGPSLVKRYADDAAAAAALFGDAGTTVYWASAPIGRSGDTIPELLAGAASSASAAVTPTWRIDAADAVLRDGAYTDDLACVPADPCPTGGAAPGFSRVRAPDGVHFCPVALKSIHGVLGECPVYSSGAQRYGRALASPLIEDYHL